MYMQQKQEIRKEPETFQVNLDSNLPSHLVELDFHWVSENEMCSHTYNNNLLFPLHYCCYVKCLWVYNTTILI